MIYHLTKNGESQPDRPLTHTTKDSYRRERRFGNEADARLHGPLVSAVVLILFIVLVGCSDKALQTVAKASRDVAAANLALSSTVIQAQANGSLTAEYARPIVQATVTVAQAGIQLDAATRGISKLSPTDRTKILAILQPVVQSLGNAVAQTNLIPNQTLKTSIMASLTALQAALATIQGVVA